MAQALQIVVLIGAGLIAQLTGDAVDVTAHCTAGCADSNRYGALTPLSATVI